MSMDKRLEELEVRITSLECGYIVCRICKRNPACNSGICPICASYGYE